MGDETNSVMDSVIDYPAGFDSIFVLARKVNDFMPVHMYDLTVEALARAGKKPSGSRIAILGWAFLNNSDDARNPPSEPYRDLLIEAGCEVGVHDPHVLEYPAVDISHELNDVVKGGRMLWLCLPGIMSISGLMQGC